MLQVVSCNKYYSYSNNNFRSTQELKKYLQEVDSTNFNYCDCCSNDSDNYSHHVDAIKMKLLHLHNDCCSYAATIIMEDSKEQVKANLNCRYHIATITIITSILSNCIAAGSFHFLACFRFIYVVGAAGAVGYCSSFDHCCRLHDYFDYLDGISFLNTTIIVGPKTFYSNSTTSTIYSQLYLHSYHLSIY